MEYLILRVTSLVKQTFNEAMKLKSLDRLFFSYDQGHKYTSYESMYRTVLFNSSYPHDNAVAESFVPNTKV